VPIRRVTIPVAAGRNLAVLVEAAVRNFVLNSAASTARRNSSTASQRLMDPGGDGVR